jgi:hypothetical protein
MTRALLLATSRKPPVDELATAALASGDELPVAKPHKTQQLAPARRSPSHRTL